MSQNDKYFSISRKVVDRITVYRREIEHLLKSGRDKVYSYELSEITGIPSTTVRKDFSIIGNKLGHVKSGYDIKTLKGIFDNILGTESTWNIAIAGIGNLGKALMRFSGFNKRGFHVVCGFDADEFIVGREISGKRIYDVQVAKELIEKYQIKMIIITVNTANAQKVLNYFAQLGIKAFLNFCPISLSKAEFQDISIENVDFAASLEALSFFLDKNNSAGVKKR